MTDWFVNNMYISYVDILVFIYSIFYRYILYSIDIFYILYSIFYIGVDIFMRHIKNYLKNSRDQKLLYIYKYQFKAY